MAYKMLKTIKHAVDGAGYKTITFTEGNIYKDFPEKLKGSMDRDKKNGPFYAKVKSGESEIKEPVANEPPEKEQGAGEPEEPERIKPAWKPMPKETAVKKKRGRNKK